ncbi:tyrosine-protein phosphatase [Paenibacillus guangzhouensis]|uniref:tyrosine-protein phosphatase n=1 Tax=Paenibacillus guangzhouensis TaxID=1473112 RepID=UPI0012669956|nr:CpsB/CapC family capsule biosynthesis tyrosine phosphatase [Paenibacillus guangzhouensis]
MIDIHTHILPGIDDGAANWSDAINMARAAVAEGITTIIATPHHANGRYHNTALEVIDHVRHMNEQLKGMGVPLTIQSGQEIRLHHDLIDAWLRKELLPLADSSYILIELPSSNIPKKIVEFIHELHVMKLKPIIAHPERNAEIVKDPDRLAQLIEIGAFAQVTTHSLLGDFGRQIERAAWSLCRSGLIHIVSSDAHHVERRGFRLGETYEVIRERMGQPWENYFQDNARRIIEDLPFGSMPKDNPSSVGVIQRLRSFFR